MKRSQPRRDWSDARAKVDAEGRCRNCGTTTNLEAAHVIGRKHDRVSALRWAGTSSASRIYVHPDRIIPLCGPFPAGCHGAEHRHELDTLPLLDVNEQAQAVADAGGLELARVRLAPSQYRDRRAA